MQKGNAIINPFMKKAQNQQTYKMNDDSPQAIDMDNFEDDNLDYIVD